MAVRAEGPTQAVRSKRLRKEVKDQIDAGELNAAEPDERLDQMVKDSINNYGA